MTENMTIIADIDTQFNDNPRDRLKRDFRLMA